MVILLLLNVYIYNIILRAKENGVIIMNEIGLDPGENKFSKINK